MTRILSKSTTTAPRLGAASCGGRAIWAARDRGRTRTARPPICASICAVYEPLLAVILGGRYGARPLGSPVSRCRERPSPNLGLGVDPALNDVGSSQASSPATVHVLTMSSTQFWEFRLEGFEVRRQRVADERRAGDVVVTSLLGKLDHGVQPVEQVRVKADPDGL